MTSWSLLGVEESVFYFSYNSRKTFPLYLPQS